MTKETSETVRDRIVKYFSVLRVPVDAGDLEVALARAERERLTHLEFLESVIAVQACTRQQRAIERRIREAGFPELKTLEAFDWKFNAKAIDRVQIEELATGNFVRRCDNVVVVGQSGVGKSHLMQAVGRKACEQGYRVRYTTSAALLEDLTASLADKTLPERLRYYARFPLLMIDEFGFDRIERMECPEAASLLFKVIDARSRKASTVLITNVDYEDWPGYLGDAPLAMALLDRIVDGAIIIKILNAKSYRAHRSEKRQRESKRRRSQE